MRWLPRLVARVPAPVPTKLFAAFLTIAALLVIVGAVGLQALSAANRRAQDLVKLERKIAAYSQLRHDTTAQLYSVASALLAKNEETLEATLRQLNQFGYDFERIQFIAKDETDLLSQLRVDYDRFVQVVTRVIELIRGGDEAAARNLQAAEVSPLVERLERLTNQLVNRAEADIVERVEASQEAYQTSRRNVIGFALGSIGLALLLGYGISSSLVEPVRQMQGSFQRIASGDFAGRLEVPNRDELGSLAANLNRMSVELDRLYRQLEAADRHKSEFLANMSHELRTPLNAVIGFSEVLDQRMFGELNNKQTEYVQDILSSGRHLLSLINDILDLSKIEAGRMDLELARFHLPAAVQNALMLVRERAHSHGIHLECALDERVGEVVADERKIKQILLNLLSNAVKFTPEGGRIEVTAVARDGTVEIAVSDTGVGIASEDQEAIFEEFRQVGGENSGKREGTGLGLTLARKFVELHGGTIWLESQVGKGSTFTFSLPVR